MAKKITEDCTNCGACAADCPSEAIAEGDDTYMIDAAKCDDCASKGSSSCMEVCPADCIVQL